MELLNIKKILIPIDFSPASLNSLNYAVMMAKRTNAEIMLLHVLENSYVSADPFFPIVAYTEIYESELGKAINEKLLNIAEKIKSQGLSNVSILTVSGRAHKEIIRVRREASADIIIMGTHGVSGFREFVVGSNTYRVVSDALCPVLSIQKENHSDGFKNILVPFSDKPHSREKVMYAIKLAEIYGSNLNVLGVDSTGTDSHTKKIMLEADQVKRIAEKHNLKCAAKTITAAYDASNVLEYAKEINADLILAMGDSTPQNLAEYFTGNFSQQIINHSSIPIISIHSAYNPNTIELWQPYNVV
jgi:nucleotide-binding universal stress UspA family protein